MDMQMDLRVVKTKQNFYNAMIELMEEKPFSQIKTVDVIRRAHVAKNTFYKYYDTVYDLYHEMIEEVVKETTAFYSRPLGYHLEDVCAFVELIVKHERIWLVALKDTSPNVLESLFRKHAQTIDEFNTQFENPKTSAHMMPDLLCDISVSMLIATIPYYLQNKHRPIEEVATEIRGTIKQFGEYCFHAYEE